MDFKISDENAGNAFFNLLIEVLAQTMSMKEIFLSLYVKENKGKIIGGHEITDELINSLLAEKTSEWRQKVKDRLYSEFGTLDIKNLFE